MKQSSGEILNFDIDKICRVCLKPSFDLSLLFDEQNAVDGVNISEMISECTIYTVRRHDEFPHLICRDCMDRVRSAYHFKKQFEKSHRTLVSFLESVSKVITETNPTLNDKCTQTDESTLYPCEKCDEKFLNYAGLRAHRSTAHRGTANICRICFKVFNRIIDLKNHIATRHPGFGHTCHECQICNKKFTRKEHVHRHMRNIHKLEPEPEEQDIDKKENELNQNATLVEAEIDYENIGKAEPNEDLLSNYDPGDFEDNTSCNEELDATNPFSSDEEDEKTLATLKTVDYIDEVAVVSNELSVKIEPVELNSINTTEIDVQIPITKHAQPLESPQDSTNRKYKCSECDKSFTRNSHLKRHLMSHKEEKPFPCTLCEKRFSRADHLKLHISRHEETKPFQCDECGRSYYRLDLLRRHKEQKHSSTITGNTDVCELCNKAFSSKNYLQKHMRQHSEKGWKCKVCSFQFDSKDSLREHAKSHNKEKSFLCSECGQCFVRNDYLIVHMRRHNGEKPYKCKYCDKAFPRGTDLNIHQKYHTGEKTHLCTICGKGFQRGYNLVVHMRVHTGERPYQCQHCPKSFAQGNDLKAHVRRHTGERFKCEICDIGFVQAYSLTQHKLAVHGIEVESRIRRVAKVSNETTQDNPIPQAEIVMGPLMEFKLDQTSNCSG